MTYYDISHLEPINKTNEDKVSGLVESMLKNGWQGCPILVSGEELITGSHRISALARIENMLLSGEIEEAPILDEDVAEDVTDIVNANLAAFEEENGWKREIDLGDIGWMLQGSWVEQYKNEIGEW